MATNKPLESLTQLHTTVESLVKLLKLIRDDKSVWQPREFFLSMLLDHLLHIYCQFILPCNFERTGEVVNFLILIQAFIKILFTRTTTPQDVPFMRLSVVKIMSFKNRSDQSSITPENLIEQLITLHIIRASISEARRSIL